MRRQHESIDEIFSSDGLIANLKDNYVPRESQIEAAKKIYEGISTDTVTFIEGETGLGKSFAYLFPALDYILDSESIDKKVIIVTAGISLQEQLFNKDVPFVINTLRQKYEYTIDEVKSILVKGRQNFVCLNKAMAEGIIGYNFGDKAKSAISDFIINTKTGDLSELDFIPDRELLESITCTKPGECLSKKCPLKDTCFYNMHKSEVHTSNVIITNYHYYYSNIRTDGKLLPEADLTIFDEAHETASIYRDFNEKKVSANSMIAIRNKISEVTNYTQLFTNIIDSVLVQNLLHKFEVEFSKLSILIKGEFDTKPLIENENDIPESIYKLKDGMFNLSEQLAKAIEIQKNACDASSKNDDEKNNKILSALGMAISNCNDVYDFLLLLKDNIKDNNIAVWVENFKGNYILATKPVDVSEQFKKSILDTNSNHIFTSATLTVAGNFEYVKSELGVETNTIEFIGKSPFNLYEQQLWYLPENSLDGNDPNFNRLYIGQIEDIIKLTKGGALCLFTSIQAMQRAYNIIKYKVGYNILCQGDKPKMKLLNEFKQDKDSCLFATKSFFTGIDIDGSSLRAVIIDKFPFPQPSEPIQKMLMKQKNSFYKHCIPQMVILLKQAVGRGVRSINDKAVIVILDNRLSSAGYKKRVSSSFNYRKQCTRNSEDVKNFIETYLEESK